VLWRPRRYVFRDEPLAEVINQFNRYRAVPIIIDGLELPRLEVSGVFDLNDAESLMEYLRAFQTVTITRLTDGTVRLSRPSSDSSFR
jgi:transmembrane sensor